MRSGGTPLVPPPREKKRAAADECDTPQRLRKLHGALRGEKSPWAKNFFEAGQFDFPGSVKEALDRLNLNLPFYAASYAVVFYAVTLPLLLYLDPLFLLFFSIAVALVHAVRRREKTQPKCGGKMCIGGLTVSYTRLVDINLFVFLMLCVFRDGLRTLCVVILMNGCFIIPHAALRRPTYFDDAELEKTRPKMVQYIIMLVLLLLVYLERDDAEEQRSRRGEDKNEK